MCSRLLSPVDFEDCLVEYILSISQSYCVKNVPHACFSLIMFRGRKRKKKKEKEKEKENLQNHRHVILGKRNISLWSLIKTIQCIVSFV